MGAAEVLGVVSRASGGDRGVVAYGNPLPPLVLDILVNWHYTVYTLNTRSKDAKRNF